MTAQEMMKSWQKFVQPDQKPGIIHPDNVLELLGACEDLRWNHDKSISIPIRIENNANSAVRRAKEGIFVLSFRSGLSEKWWREAMECLCFFFGGNIQDKLADRMSPYERRCGTQITVTQYTPCGADNFFIQSLRIFINLVQRCFQGRSSDTR